MDQHKYARRANLTPDAIVDTKPPVVIKMIVSYSLPTIEVMFCVRYSFVGVKLQIFLLLALLKFIFCGILGIL